MVLRRSKRREDGQAESFPSLWVIGWLARGPCPGDSMGVRRRGHQDQEQPRSPQLAGGPQSLPPPPRTLGREGFAQLLPSQSVSRPLRREAAGIGSVPSASPTRGRVRSGQETSHWQEADEYSTEMLPEDSSELPAFKPPTRALSSVAPWVGHRPYCKARGPLFNAWVSSSASSWGSWERQLVRVFSLRLLTINK